MACIPVTTEVDQSNPCIATGYCGSILRLSEEACAPTAVSRSCALSRDMHITACSHLFTYSVWRYGVVWPNHYPAPHRRMGLLV
ncbi:hypothetical protein FKM82_002331 [Ascaphus truei]